MPQSARLSVGGGCNCYLGNAQIAAHLNWASFDYLLVGTFQLLPKTPFEGSPYLLYFTLDSPNGLLDVKSNDAWEYNWQYSECSGDKSVGRGRRGVYIWKISQNQYFRADFYVRAYSKALQLETSGFPEILLKVAKFSK